LAAKNNPLMGLLITVIGIGFAIWGTMVVMEARSAANWPTTEGTIVVSKFDRNFNTSSSGKGKWYYDVKIKYSYTVDSLEYESKRVDFKSANYHYKSEVIPSAIARRYPVGKKVDVYYNPDDPEKAVLKTEITFMTYIGLLIGIFLIGLGVFLFMRSGNEE
jgi:hypothetical protein